MEQQTKASIVVVTYNSMATLEECLSSVLHTVDVATETVVVDNASKDGTRAFLEGFAKDKPRIRVVCNEQNLGYSAAANLGIEASKGEYVVLLNPDTIVRDGWLDRMLKVCDLPKVGAVAPVSNVTAGIQYIEFHLPKHEERHPPDVLHEWVRGLNAGRAVEAKLLMGFCLVVPRRVIEEVGPLDEGLFLGSDDLDYSWRLRLRGYRLMVATDVFVQHVGHASFESLPKEETRRLLDASSVAFAKKLEAHYGRGNVPTSHELFGTDIFDPPYDLWPTRQQR